jgi:outer membrane protein TolC
MGNLFSSPAMLWSLGVSATQTLFDNGQVKAAVEGAGAAYRQTVANYRATVLSAIQEVSDALGSQAAQARSEDQLRQAVQAAERSLALSDVRYRQGVASYLEVITAEQAALGYRRQWVQNQGAQQLTAVQLAKALGGGYEAAPRDRAAEPPAAPAQ